MNEPSQQSAPIERLAPMNLMGAFTRSRFAFWIAVALAVHIVVTGLLSVRYIRDRWIDPEGAAQRKAAATAAAERAAGLAPAAAPAAAGASTGTLATADGGPVTADQVTLDDRKDTPIVKAITEKPKPGETPATPPDDLGISIQDTSVK